LYSSLNSIRVIKSEKMRWGTCNLYAKLRNDYNTLVGKTHEKRTFGKVSYRWEDDSERDAKEIRVWDCRLD